MASVHFRGTFLRPRRTVAAAMALLPLLAGCVLSNLPDGVGSGSTLSSQYLTGAAGAFAASPTPSAGIAEPSIIKLAANPNSVTGPGQAMALTCEAVDAHSAPSYVWSATGGTLSVTQGQTVTWIPPKQAGNYAVTVLVSTPTGGAVTGAFNLTVEASGSAHLVNTDPADPTPTPVPTATPQSYGQGSGGGSSWNSTYGSDGGGYGGGGYDSYGGYGGGGGYSCQQDGSSYTANGPYGPVTVYRDRTSCY